MTSYKSQVEFLSHLILAIGIVWVVPDYIEIPLVAAITYNSASIRKKVTNTRNWILEKLEKEKVKKEEYKGRVESAKAMINGFLN